MERANYGACDRRREDGCDCDKEMKTFVTLQTSQNKLTAILRMDLCEMMGYERFLGAFFSLPDTNKLKGGEKRLDFRTT